MNKLRKFVRSAALSMLPLWLVSGVSFSAPPCDETHFQQALLALGRVDGWEALYQFYKRYPNCGDGYLGQGFTTAICGLFAEHWDDANVALERMHRDKGFKAFLIGHIDASAIPETLHRIDLNVRSACPQEYRSECSAIEEEVTKGLKYLAENNLPAEPPKPSDQAPLDPFGYRKDRS